MSEMQEVFDRRLIAFGYAPGWYMLGPCRACGKPLDMVDKRAWRCEPCARDALIDDGLRGTVIDAA